MIINSSLQNLLVSPTEKEFDELGASLKHRIEEGNGETIFNIQDNDSNLIIK